MSITIIQHSSITGSKTNDSTGAQLLSVPGERLGTLRCDWPVCAGEAGLGDERVPCSSAPGAEPPRSTRRRRFSPPRPLCDLKLRVRLSLQNQYNLARAQQSYKSLVQIHEKNGECFHLQFPALCVTDPVNETQSLQSGTDRLFCV